jgi:hypothetical protein
VSCTLMQSTALHEVLYVMRSASLSLFLLSSCAEDGKCLGACRS